MAVSQEEIIAGIAEIIEEVTGIEPSEVTPEKSFVDDLDIDSLSMVEIAVQTEDKYGVKIPDEDLAGLRTVGDVVSYIQKLEEEDPEAAAALRAKLESGEPRGRRQRQGKAGSRQQVTKPSTANGGYPSVVVTAVAATTSLAPDIESTWKGLLAGESGIRVLEDDFVTKWDLPVKIGGHLKEPVDIHMGRLDMRRMSYVQRLAKYLSGQLWETAGNPELDPDRFTVVVGHRSGRRRADRGELRPDERGRPPQGVAARRSDDHAQRRRGGGRAAARGPRRGDDSGVGLFVGLGGHRPRVAPDRHG